MNSDYLKKIERLLYSYPGLKKHLQLRRTDLSDIEKEGLKRRSPSVVFYHGGVGVMQKTEEEDPAARYNATKDRTQRLIARLEAAIECVCSKEYARFIELKYFDLLSIEEICERMSIGRSTAFRIKNRVLCDLALVLFGVDVIGM